MAEAAFSEDGKYFSSISQDGRLRVWDTETNVLKQEYTPDLHLTSPPSCLQWITVTQPSGSSQKNQGRRKSSTNEQEFQCIALGTTSGKILIYSVSQAKVETVLNNDNKEIHRRNIKCLDWHRNYGLFSCNKENIVLEWNLQSASVKFKYNVNFENKSKQADGISAIKLVPHNKNTQARFLITSSTQVRIWRLHGGDAEVIKCLGHNAAQKALLAITSLKDTTWLIEGSQTERLLSFWDVTIADESLPQLNGDSNTPNKKKRKKSTSAPIVVPTPTYNFVLEDAPRLIDVTVIEDEGNKLLLAAATRSGVVHYYGHILNGASTKPIKPTVSVQVSSPDAQPLPLQCCKLSGHDLLLGYSQGPQLLFEKVTPDLKSKTQVLIRGDTKHSKKKKAKEEASKVRSDAGKEEVTYVEPMGGVTRKRAQPGGKVEVPMEERLANLSVDLQSRRQAAVNHNLTKLLMQGLHSKDKKIIQTVLQDKNYKVALQTVSNLPVDYIPQLLEQLMDMANRNTRQCVSVCPWVRAALRCQAAALLAAAAAGAHQPHQRCLAGLLAVFTQRRSHLCQLLNLKGRLELTIEQRGAKDDPTEQQPILEYNDSSEEEMELEHSESDHSEEEWREQSSDSGGE